MQAIFVFLAAFAALVACQSSITCSQAIKKECSTTPSGMSCLQCIKKNYKSILNMADGCTRSDFESACGTNHNGTRACPATLKKLCKNFYGKGDSCFNCTTSNSAKLDDADCSNQYIQSFCRGKNTTNDCTSALASTCPQVQHAGASCFTCVKNNTDSLRDAGCNTYQYSQYCKSGAVPTPGGGSQCMTTLGEMCGSSKGQGANCYRCIFSNYSRAVAADCTGKNYHSFCGTGSQTEGCTAGLKKYCGAYTGERYYCFQCVVSNTDDLKAAGCTVDNYDSFCEGKTGDNCTATLKQVCGRQKRNEKMCSNCVEQNKATTDAAGCQPSDISKFCSKGGKSHGRGPSVPFAPFAPPKGIRRADEEVRIPDELLKQY